MSEQKPLPNETIDESRRRWLKGSSAAALVTVAPGVLLWQAPLAREADEPVTSKVRWGMLVYTTRCNDNCSACVSACASENGLTGHGRPETDAQWIRKLMLRNPETGHTRSLPMMCQHCEHPPCVDVCPTGASFKRADGIVLVDKHTCIGCRYCMMACPYKARSFIHEDLTDQKPHAPRGKGTVESCTLCVHRVDAGGIPACVEACENTGHQALVFGDLNDPESLISRKLRTLGATQIRADLGTNPGIHYRGI